MAKNIFLDKNQFKPKLKRNAYDMSYLNNGTYEEGYLYPLDYTEVTYGDSVRIDISAALRTMPMVWPIQTPVLVKFYVFYDRYRNCWTNFEDFRFNNKQSFGQSPNVVHPFISQPVGSDFWKTGGLADYLGIPTTYASDNIYSRFSIANPPSSWAFIPTRTVLPFYRSVVPISSSTPIYVTDSPQIFSASADDTYKYRCFFINHALTLSNLDGQVAIHKDLLLSQNVDVRFFLIRCPKGALFTSSDSCVIATKYLSPTSVSDIYSYFDFNVGSVTAYINNGLLDVNNGLFGFLKSYYNLSESVSDSFDFYIVASDYTSFGSIPNFSFLTEELDGKVLFYVGSGVKELNDVANPFAGSNPQIPLNALPFRVYERCYRSFFQDFINEPFVIDGVEQYNRYLTNDGDGADTTPYHLFRRNWEADFLTSAKPSPQQGVAPLVGITSSGDAILVNANGEDVRVSLVTGADGDTMQTYREYPDQNVDGSVRRRLLDMATSGFSINSFRNTNAFQQWLEANWRRSLKYKDQVLSNFGVDLEYKELDMPEFLGGFTIPLDVNAITQTSSSVDGQPLGQQGANAGAFGSAKHSISHYCDEEGAIITLMCITPIPVYSQLLNKMWLKSNPLDYYNPQFGKIGNQPITYEEVCPIQAYNEGRTLQDTFGYQRPWYHLISATDEVHGKFRTDMRGFLYNRTFANAPELGADFLHIDPKQMNDIFIDTIEGAAHFYGQIGIKKYKKTCIPRYNVPSLN